MAQIDPNDGGRYTRVIDRVIGDWIPGFVSAMEEQAKSKLNSASGKGVKSFRAQYNPANAQAVAEMLFGFNEYLRYQDMKRNQAKNPPHAAIMQWVKDKGIEKFLARYPQSFSDKLSEDKKASRIAWGLIKGNAFDNAGRKRWYNKRKQAKVFGLYERLVKAIGEEYIATTKSAIT